MAKRLTLEEERRRRKIEEREEAERRKKLGLGPAPKAPYFYRPKETAPLQTNIPLPTLTAEQEEQVARKKLEAEVPARAKEIKEEREAEKITPELMPVQEIPPEIIEPSITAAQVPAEEKTFLQRTVSSYEEVQKMIKEGKVVAGTVPIGGIPVPSANVAKISLASRAITALKFLHTHWKAVAGTIFGVKVIADIPEKRMADVLAELRVAKTRMGRGIIKYLNLGPEYALIALDILDELEADLNEYDRKIQKEKSRSYSQRILGWGKYGESQKYLIGLREYLIPMRELCYRAAAGGEISPEEMAIITTEIEAIGEES